MSHFSRLVAELLFNELQVFRICIDSGSTYGYSKWHVYVYNGSTELDDVCFRDKKKHKTCNIIYSSVTLHILNGKTS